jgi:hypothetical protein
MIRNETYFSPSGIAMTRIVVQVSPIHLINRIYYGLNLFKQYYLVNKDNSGE